MEGENPVNNRVVQSTILIIDDDPEILLLLETSLRDERYHLVTRGNGESGLEAARIHNPAVIICDWMMPGMDGLEVCRRIKSNPDLRLSYFILLTAWGNTDDRVAAFDTGADDFIQKPPNIKELRARVRAGLRIHELTRELHLKQTEMEFDLSQARDYLQSLLPRHVESALPSGLRWSVDCIYIPSAHLGGDTFHYQWLDEGHLSVFLLDVAGHGVGAALLSVSILNVLRSGSLNADLTRPAEVLAALNATFPMERQNNLFFTMWYGVYCIDSSELRFSCAGHPPAILSLHNGEHRLLKTRGIPVGMVKGFSFASESVQIAGSFLLTLFSDGIYETVESSTGGDLQRWIEIVKAQPSRTPPFQIRENLEYFMESVLGTEGNIRFDDDVSILQIGLDW